MLQEQEQKQETEKVDDVETKDETIIENKPTEENVLIEMERRIIGKINEFMEIVYREPITKKDDEVDEEEVEYELE